MSERPAARVRRAPNAKYERLLPMLATQDCRCYLAIECPTRIRSGALVRSPIERDAENKNSAHILKRAALLESATCADIVISFQRVVSDPGCQPSTAIHERDKRTELVGRSLALQTVGGRSRA